MTAINCPVCSAPFKEVVKDRILIDVCTRCQGVWLDRGELEKLLSAVQAAEQYAAPNDDDRRAEERGSCAGRQRDFDDDDADRHRSRDPRYRRKSKLESLFDVFD